MFGFIMGSQRGL